MKFIDIIRMCLRNLIKRKARTILTVTGVVIGTCAIIVMISLGIGMDAAQKDMISEWADLTLINVYDYGRSSSTTDTGKLELNDDTLKQIGELDHVQAVTPFYDQIQTGYQIAVYSGEYMISWAPFVGVYMDQLEEFGYKLSEGRWKNDKDPKATVLFGQQTCNNIINYNDPNEQVIQYDENWNVKYTPLTAMKDAFSVIPLTIDTNTWSTDYSVIDSYSAENKDYEEDLNVVGVIEGNNRDYYTMQGIFIDISYMKTLINAYNELNPDNQLETFNGKYNNVRVRVDDMDRVADVEKEIQDLGFETYSDNQSRDNMKKQTQTIQMMLGALAAVSLFVAALNITNTMIMSIIERTKEIGIMKVLGCDISRIRMLFLGEAAAIGFLGGVVGIVLSYGVSFILNTFLSSQMMSAMGMGDSYMYGVSEQAATTVSVIPPWLAVAALGFATVVGVLSGFYPANRSVKISALSAITHD